MIKNYLTKGLKVFVVDTNVLLYDPNAISAFDENIIILSDSVLDELDRNKVAPGEVGYNAREVARILDSYRQDLDNGNLADGYRMENGGILKIETNHHDVTIPNSWTNEGDTRLLKVALGLKNEIENSNEVIVVSNDLFVRIKASVLGIKAEMFENQAAKDINYKGRTELYTNKSIIDLIHKESFLEKPFYNKTYYTKDNEVFRKAEAKENEYFLIKSTEGKSSVIVYYCNNTFYKVDKKKIMNIEPITSGQTMIQDALLDNCQKTPLVIIKGPAGTGKTLLSVSVGLDAVKNGLYNRVLYLRANVFLDEEIGFLPGDEEEKLEWMLRPVKDNLEVMFKRNKDVKAEINRIFNSQQIKVEPVGFMRGRSLQNQFVIIDEAQNLSPKQVKTLLSRAGKNTKIVLIGDPEQIDKPFLNKRNNGLSYAFDKLKDSSLVKQLELLNSESERSPISYEIINMLK